MDWMSQLPTHLQHSPLNQLAIPGSHNSMTYYLDINSEIGPDTEIGNCVKCLIKCSCGVGKKVVYNWSVTQSLNIMAQLEAGIRYIDVRIGRKENGEICFLHALYGMTVKEGLQEIRQFLNLHSKEIVLIDFSHFYDMETPDHQQVMEVIQEIFGNKLCPPDTNIEVLFLNTLWRFGYQVIVFYQHQEVLQNRNLWSEQFILSSWPNTKDTRTMIEFLKENAKMTHQNNFFFVTQGILTPDSSTILKNLCGSLKETLAVKANSSLVKLLQESHDRKGFNIIIADFVELNKFIPEVLKLNDN